VHPTKLVICILLLISTTAGAAPSAESGTVIIVGKAQVKERIIAATAVRSAARTIGWALIETPLGEKEASNVMACLKAKGPRPWDCVGALNAARGVQRVIVLSLEPGRSPDGQPVIALMAQVIVQGGKALPADSRLCSQCVDDTLKQQVFELTRRLIEQAALSAPVTSEPTPPGGGTRPPGTGTPPPGTGTPPPGTGTPPPGTGTPPPGTGTPPPGTGTPPPGTGTPPPGTGQGGGVVGGGATGGGNSSGGASGGSVVVGGGGGEREGGVRSGYLIAGAVVGAGVLAAGTGVVLQFVKDSPPQGEDQPKRLVSAPGITLMAIGGAAIGVGAYLWIRASKSPRRAPVSTPTAMIVNGGGVIGWVGQF